MFCDKWTDVILILLICRLGLGFSESVMRRCLEEPDPGPCKFFQLKWYWDDKANECQKFNYGGCLGNQNRFNTKESCRRHCLFHVFDQSNIPAICFLDADPGYCDNENDEEKADKTSLKNSLMRVNPIIPHNAQWWYYFDAELGVCSKFLYYGCSVGNDNRFYSLYQCRTVCACDKCDIRTSYCKYYSKFNYTCECRDGYEKNENNECIDRNECEESEKLGTLTCGDRNSICTNLFGSYRCDCKPGFIRKDNNCIYVGIGSASVGSSCTDCSEFADCQNGICQCRIGFIGNGFNCEDTDECTSFESEPDSDLIIELLSSEETDNNSTSNSSVTLSLSSTSTTTIAATQSIKTKKRNNCDENALCQNTNGSYFCECAPGFAGNGRICTNDNTACLDQFDSVYKSSCGVVRSNSENNDWRVYYYFQHTTKRCEMFWYSGCGRDVSPSRNIFSQLSTCQDMCERTNVLQTADSCWDKFDPVYRDQCGAGDWQQRYYYDTASGQCRLFWWDGCRSDSSHNFFTDLLSCQWLCQSKTKQVPTHHPRRQHHQHNFEITNKQDTLIHQILPEACYEVFDERYRDECNGGDWRRFYYFDQLSKFCIPFWYDGCRGESQNLFSDKRACFETCEEPTMRMSQTTVSLKSTSTTPSAISTTLLTTTAGQVIKKAESDTKDVMTNKKDKLKAKFFEKGKNAAALLRKAKMQEEKDENSSTTSATTITTASSAASTTSTATTTIKTGNETSVPRSKSDLVFEEIFDSLPPVNGNCDDKPCQNGGTCIMAPKTDGKDASFECFCPKMYAGYYCELRPCDVEPCKNNGTCRTTRARLPFFFCECTPDWGGKTCIIPIPNANNRKYGKNVQLLSSGRIEWIEQIKKLNSNNSTTNDSTIEEGNEDDKSSMDLQTNNSSETESRDGSSTGGVLKMTVGNESPTRTLSKPSVTDGTPERFNALIGGKIIFFSLIFHWLCKNNFLR